MAVLGRRLRSVEAVTFFRRVSHGQIWPPRRAETKIQEPEPGYPNPWWEGYEQWVLEIREYDCPKGVLCM